ncbi:MAG TPA: hypothetical protein VES67_12425 [Vicinamibacterales bacterium]|nr:hypothetical protein [Vicinamibacterales bacterium]
MLLATSPAYAQGQRQPLEQLQTKLRIGERIQVVDGNRTIIRGRFDGVAGSSLRLTVNGRIIEVQESQIYQVRKQRPEPDGVLIGLGIGALAGLTYVRMQCRGASEHPDCLRADSLVLGAPIAGAAALIDLFLTRFDTIFERVTSSTRRWRISPMLNGRQKGIVMMVAF